MGGAAVERAYAVGLIHAEVHAEQGFIVVIARIEDATFAVEVFVDVAGEIHHVAPFDAGDGHLLDILHWEIDEGPVAAIVDVAVEVDLIKLVEFAGRVVH